MFTFVVLLLLQSFDELEGAVLSVLAPNLRDTFHVSDGVIVFISAAMGAFLALGALPLGWLADRYRRGRIIGWASAAFAAAVCSCGLAVNAFALFLGRLGTGVAKSNAVPVQGSLVADTFPIEIRGRLAARPSPGGPAWPSWSARRWWAGSPPWRAGARPGGVGPTWWSACP